MIEGRLSIDAPADIRLRRIIGSEHPLWTSALETIERWPRTMKRMGDQTWPPWFDFLDQRRVEPLEATGDDVEAFLDRFERQNSKITHRGTLRALYRSAFDLGLIDKTPVPDVVIGLDYRANIRLPNAEVVRLIDALSAECSHWVHRLRARRDLVLVALACSFECTTESLRLLRWGDVDLTLGRAKARIQGRRQTDWVTLVDVVAARITDLRAELERHGVDVVAGDALLPALGRRIEWGWTLPERELLAPLERGSVSQAFLVMTRRARVGTSLESGKYFNHRWLKRGPTDLPKVLLGSQSPSRLLVPMRRTAA